MSRLRQMAFTLCLISLLGCAYAMPSSGGRGDGAGGASPTVGPDSPIFRKRARHNCLKYFRTLDGICTNDASEKAKFWGSTGQPQSSYFGINNRRAAGSSLRSPRFISNVLSEQKGNVYDENGVAEIATFLGQFVDHGLVRTPTNPRDRMHFRAPDGDTKAKEYLREKSFRDFQFHRSKREAVRLGGSVERPTNSLTSVVDLVAVYGPDEGRSRVLRLGRGGKMKVSGDGKNLLPKNVDGLHNAPDARNKTFFLAGDHRANEHPVLTALHTLFVREHNRIADELSSNARFGRLGDDKLFRLAKRINEAQYQKIVFEEWFPRITGSNLPRYSGFKQGVNPTVSLSFSTAAYRVGHTMVGNSVKYFAPGNRVKHDKSLKLSETFFQAVKPITQDGIEGFLRGALNSRAQKVDLLVVDALRNHLFKNIKGEDINFDLVAINIQRGRDHNLPSYSDIRREFSGRGAARRWSDISSNAAVQAKLAVAYDSAGQVEALPGMFAEDHVAGSSFGRTILGLWKREFTRLRDGDRLFFRATNSLPTELTSLPRVYRLLHNVEFECFRQMILDNTKIKSEDLPRKMFKVM